MEKIQIGKLITDGERRRDAIHIAIAPVTAAESLDPGQDVGFWPHNQTESVASVEDCIGIVDPYLTEPIRKGDRFYLFLYPNTVTSLRHIWTHPAYTTQVPRNGND